MMLDSKTAQKSLNKLALISLALLLASAVGACRGGQGPEGAQSGPAFYCSSENKAAWFYHSQTFSSATLESSIERGRIQTLLTRIEVDLKPSESGDADTAPAVINFHAIELADLRMDVAEARYLLQCLDTPETCRLDDNQRLRLEQFLSVEIPGQLQQLSDKYCPEEPVTDQSPDPSPDHSDV